MRLIIVNGGASHLIGSADLHAGSALIRHVPSHMNEVSYTRAVRPNPPSKRKIKRRYGEPTKSQYDSGVQSTRFGTNFVGGFKLMARTWRSCNLLDCLKFRSQFYCHYVTVLIQKHFHHFHLFLFYR